MSAVEKPKLLTFKSGGWVILLALALMFGVFAWAVAPAVFRTFDRPPGDGRAPATYGFDLSSFAGERDMLATATLYRDMVPVLNMPGWMTIEELEEARKPLVSVDRVIGIEIDGVIRAYPIKYMNVHEIVNDEIAGIPIAVTYNWLCDSVRVFDRRVGDVTVEFGHSGLVWNSNMLMYDRQALAGSVEAQPGASLWVQMSGEAISGPKVGESLRTLPCQFVNWAAWRALHPETTVMRPVAEMAKRYKKALPVQYFREGKVAYPVAHEVGDAMLPMSRVVIVSAGGERVVFPADVIDGESDNDGVWRTEVGGEAVEFTFRRPGLTDDKNQMPTVEVRGGDGAVLDDVLQCFWFAWHAVEPGDGHVVLGQR